MLHSSCKQGAAAGGPGGWRVPRHATESPNLGGRRRYFGLLAAAVAVAGCGTQSVSGWAPPGASIGAPDGTTKTGSAPSVHVLSVPIDDRDRTKLPKMVETVRNAITLETIPGRQAVGFSSAVTVTDNGYQIALTLAAPPASAWHMLRVAGAFSDSFVPEYRWGDGPLPDGSLGVRFRFESFPTVSAIGAYKKGGVTSLRMRFTEGVIRDPAVTSPIGVSAPCRVLGIATVPPAVPALTFVCEPVDLDVPVTFTFGAGLTSGSGKALTDAYGNALGPLTIQFSAIPADDEGGHTANVLRPALDAMSFGAPSGDGGTAPQ